MEKGDIFLCLKTPTASSWWEPARVTGFHTQAAPRQSERLQGRSCGRAALTELGDLGTLLSSKCKGRVCAHMPGNVAFGVEVCGVNLPGCLQVRGAGLWAYAACVLLGVSEGFVVLKGYRRRCSL